jgi:cysteine desulfurase/selenocysteine lyase
VRPFDVEAVRGDFPILGRTVHGRPLVYLDSAASAQKPEMVISAMGEAMRRSYANVHRGLHTLANEATEAYEAARAGVARFIGAPAPETIVFTRGATQSINLVAASLGRSFAPGDEIVISVMEHHSNVVPWMLLRDRAGVVVRWANCDDDGRLDLVHLASLLTDRTRLVAITHMSNVLGTVNDLQAVTRLAHAAGALVLVDGCQGVVHLPVDVAALDVDFYAFSGHKLYGPTGIGVLYGKAEHLASMPPYEGGGEMIEQVTEEYVTFAPPPQRFEAGTPSIIEAIGLDAAIRWIGGLDQVAIAGHKRRLLAEAETQIADIPGIRVLGQAEGKGPVLTFTLEGAHPHDLAQILDRHGVAIRAGHHCAQPLMKRFGVTASARASFGVYNTASEVDVFVSALRKARQMLI